MIKNYIKSHYHSIKKHIQTYKLGKRYETDTTFLETKELTKREMSKKPFRFDIINFVAQQIEAKQYLEIGVRNPNDNFKKINIQTKYAVDPGVEFEENPVDFKMTSDDFFDRLSKNELTIKNDIKFDVIFIDGLHLAEQVEKDIQNSIQYLSEEGFIFLHDCNPPSEYHARETYTFFSGPAGGGWNGTTWKAFFDARTKFHSCCIDTDWGVGIISKKERGGFNKLKENTNKYFEFKTFSNNRIESLNLMNFQDFKEKFQL